MPGVMKNMKISKAEHVATSTDQLMANEGPEYPYGLRIRLDAEVMNKLDIGRLPEVGTMMALHAVVEVVEVSLDPNDAGTRNKSMSLQITDMELLNKGEGEPKPVGVPEQAKTLLGS